MCLVSAGEATVRPSVPPAGVGADDEFTVPGGSMDLAVNALGPLELRASGRAVSFGGPVARRILSRLALRPDESVTMEDLVTGAWGERPPATAEQQVRKLVSSLRLLATDSWEVVKTTAGGYRLSVGATESDVLRFRALSGALPSRGTLEDRQIEDFHRAARLWRGSPVSGSVPHGAEADIQALRHEHVLFLLAMSRTFAASGIGLQARHHVLQAQSFYADSLDAQDLLAECRQVLNTRTTTSREPAGIALEPPSVRHSSLPRDVRDFRGRTDELREAIAGLDPSTGSSTHIVALSGMAGVGKSALAVRTAYEVQHRYPDGVLFIDLLGYTPGRDAMPTHAAVASLLVQLGCEESDIPSSPSARLAMWRARTRDRALLVVADNASSTRAVSELVPTSPHAAMLVTSRRLLGALAGAKHVRLAPPSSETCLEILTTYLDGRAPYLTPKTLAGLVEWAGHLPLGLRLACAQVLSASMRDCKAWLNDEVPDVLDVEAPGIDLFDTLAESVLKLQDERRREFLQLAESPVEVITVESIRRVLGRGHQDARRACMAFDECHLLLPVDDHVFRIHPLVRATARRLASGLGATSPSEQPAPAGSA